MARLHTYREADGISGRRYNVGRKQKPRKCRTPNQKLNSFSENPILLVHIHIRSLFYKSHNARSLVLAGKSCTRSRFCCFRIIAFLATFGRTFFFMQTLFAALVDIGIMVLIIMRRVMLRVGVHLCYLSKMCLALSLRCFFF